LKQQLNHLIERRNPDSTIEWQDIADERTAHYGSVEHRDTVRKAFKGLYEYLDAGWTLNEPNNLKNESETVPNTDIDDKIRELQKERHKNQVTAIELNRLNRQNDRFELFYENIKDVIQTLPVPHFTYEDSQLYGNQKEYLLSIADIHGGANFKSENNEYSLEICAKRFNKLLNYMIAYVQEHNITKLNVVELGDSIQGMLRISDVKLNETPVVHAVVYVAKLIANFLNDLSEYCYIDYYHVPSANHTQTRCLGTKANELAAEDLEYVIANYIKDVLVNNGNINVYTNFGHEYIEIPIFNYNIIALHGHQINNIQNSLRDLSMLHRKFYDYCILGHTHASNDIAVGEGISNDVEVLVCSSFIGSDPYSDKLMKGSKAACKVFTFDDKNGHIRTDKIILN
jgi:negative regulator of genetic competence, sporulation and motility